MDQPITPSDRIKSGLARAERSRAWLARNTGIPLTTLDRKLRGTGVDLTLAQVHAIAEAIEIPLSDLVETVPAEAPKAVNA